MQVSRAPHVAVVVLILFSLAAWAESPAADPDLSGPFASLLHSSAFLHGYLHGYEAGFHYGDLDYQLGRAPDLRRYRHQDDGYRSEFRNHGAYRRGFRQAFQVAYADALGGRRFRAADSLRQLAGALPAPVPATDPAVDATVAAGYQHGLSKGLTDARGGVTFASAADGCHAPRPSSTYCAIYDGAFRLGYADGYLNQSPAPPAVATTASR